MPKLFSTDTDEQVKRLSKQNLTNFEIKKKLAKDKIDIHLKTISRMPKKFENLIRKQNPAAYRQIKSKTSLSLGSINKVIHQNLGKLTRKNASS